MSAPATTETSRPPAVSRAPPRTGPGGNEARTLADLIGVSRQVMSNHLACLRGCGLVVAVPDGRRSRYELADERLAHALGALLGVVLAVEPDAGRDGCC